ncbi:uncharacterized protein LOC127873689 [Dreissena polymorpha]|uniref:Uncharacterized protein n=1 Tax=Dreissena polymorpha TaxID=45954 RepID=A0A9D4QY04_DREPO|nr:uncharacterized protein LOC127873689 [Dreissena polymorpha]KAH3847739.1 hypothetical protein DPMN_090070 [Dreissena polymorpha]
MSLKMFVVVVAAVVYLAGVSDALKCHVCTGRGGDACSDGSFVATASIQDGCGGSCLTTLTSSGVSRACALFSMASGCTTTTLIDGEIKTCYCDTDLCNAGTAGTAASSQNGAERAGVSMISASILAGLTLVARSFM